MSQAKGQSATLIFDGRYVTIERSGILSRMTVGKGTKKIPVKSITAIQWKPAGPLMNGYIEFSLGGGNESRSQFGSATYNAVQNENAVVFTKKQMREFEVIRDEIEASINEGTSTTSDSIPTLIKQLNELKNQGLITAEEYTNKKSELLSRM